MNDFQSALDPFGPQAARIETLWWVLFWVATVVVVLVTAVVILGAYRGWHRRRDDDSAGPLAIDQHSERRLGRVVAISVGATALVLIGFLFSSVSTGRVVASMPPGPSMLIRVTGHQWWWDIEYADTNPSRRLRTANEIHIPVGQPVRLELDSRDVIHSFWAPNLHGKRDLIPGERTHTWFQADTPGVYRAQCAEFCGHQHAKMALYVVAQPQEEFRSWYEAQLLPAGEPVDSVTRRGYDVFMSSTCVMCHMISGTLAASRIGPDLTHIGSRLSIAAGTLPNTRGHMAGWILDPQRIKPGVRMPPNQLEPDDLQALLVYLESLR